MGTNHSTAARLRWANVSVVERARRMSVIAKIKQQKLSPEERKKIASKMVRKRELLRKKGLLVIKKKKNAKV